MSGVVLSLFPGLDLLGEGFRKAGFTVLRGPDLIWGQDLRDFDERPLRAMHFDGIIAGVPCQAFSKAACRKNHENYWPLFSRIVDTVKPRWALAECVPEAESQVPEGFEHRVMNFRSLGSAQARWRLIAQRGLPGLYARLNRPCPDSEGLQIRHENGYPSWKERAFYRTVIGNGEIIRNSGSGEPARCLTDAELLDAFDLPADYLDRLTATNPRFSRSSIRRLITQGVPMAAAYSLAMAVRHGKGAQFSEWLSQTQTEEPF